MSRTRRLMGGLVMMYGYQALLVLVGLWLAPFYLGHIGQQSYGLWLAGTQLLGFLTLADFGVVALLPLETGYATGRAGGFENATDLPEIVGRTVRIVFYQLPIVLLIAAIMWWTIPAQWQSLRGPLGLALSAFVLGFPLRILPALLLGLQDIAFVNGIQAAVWLIATASSVLMVLAGAGLYALAGGWLISQFAMTPLALYRLRARFPGVLPHRLPPLAWDAARTQAGKGFWVTIAQLAQLLTSIDLIIIGRVLGPSAVVPYSCTMKLPSVLGNQANMLMQTAEPALAELRAGESRERILQALIALSQGVLTFTGLVFCVVLVINHWFVDWWVTGRQYAGFAVTLAVLLSIAIRHWTGMTAYTVFSFGHQRRISLTNLCDGAVTAASCFVLVRLFGVVGAPVGSILGACLVSLPANFLKIAADVGVSVPRMINAMVSGWIWRFVLLACGAAWIAAHWSPRNLLEGAGAAAAMTVVYTLFMLPNILREPLGKYIRPLASAVRAKYFPVQVKVSA